MILERDNLDKPKHLIKSKNVNEIQLGNNRRVSIENFQSDILPCENLGPKAVFSEGERKEGEDGYRVVQRRSLLFDRRRVHH